MSWQDEAACKGQSVLFFSSRPTDRQAAVAVCKTCPVLGECRGEAIRETPLGLVIAGADLHDVSNQATAIRMVNGDIDPSKVATRPTQCVICSRWWDAFVGAGRKPSYCSDVCREDGEKRRSAARRGRSRERAGPTPPTPTACAICGTVWDRPAKSGTARRYCSDDCRKAANAMQHRRRRLAKR